MITDRFSVPLLLVGIIVLAGCLGIPRTDDQTARSLTGTSISTAAGQESTSIASERETQPAYPPGAMEGLPTTTPTRLASPVEVTAFPEPPLQRVPTPVPGQPIGITYIDMINAEKGWAIGGNRQPGDRILSTRDGGQTWRDVTPPETAPVSAYLQSLITGYFPDSEKAWVTFYSDQPENNVAWRTLDGGQTWGHGHPVPNDSLERYEPRFLQFVDDNYGWLYVSGLGLGNEYVSLFATTDGGETWVKLIDPNTSGPHGCVKTGMLFADAQHGWLTRDCSGILAAGGAELDETIDGGRTWGPRQLPPPEGVPGLYFQLTSCGLHSLNLFSPQSGSFVLKCLNSGDPGQIQQFFYSTMDGGESWFTNPYPDGSLLMLDQNFGWALSREIYQTRDGGMTWEHLKTVNWDGQFDFIDESTGFAVARSEEQIALVRTDDDGRTWVQINPVMAGSDF